MFSSLSAAVAPHDLYPQRSDEKRADWIDRTGGALVRQVARMRRASRGRIDAIVKRVNALEPAMQAFALEELRGQAAELSRRLRREGLTDEGIAQGFALVRRAAELTIGMRHFDVQLMGAAVMVSGMVAEMQTGEGKTLTATLAASTAALAGWPVHVITVNDYLVARDAELMRPIYESLGLSVSAVVAEMEHGERQVAYRADVVYCSNKTVVFDYLRDRIVLGETTNPLQLQVERIGHRHPRTEKLLLRGLYFAIVDEADSVLVDEARTPLIISAARGAAGDEEIARTALAISRQLNETEHFKLYKAERRVVLTEAGRQALIDLCYQRTGVWNIALRREELILRALTADYLYVRDEHYLVREGKVQVIDEFTGRVMPDRSWGQGLHQIIEVKEDCEVTHVRETLARISYQRFFRRYLHLSGMTGTAAEVKREFGSVFNLPVFAVPTNRPSQRRVLPEQVFANDDEKWRYIASRVAELHRMGVAVLIGTRSVIASERASRELTALGITHAVLNAKQDREEAEIIARAGRAHQVTIATNMAGRGTDIALDDLAMERGGLHVILTERHEARRIDRQLAGRAARQGNPGAFEAALSLEDALLVAVRHSKLERLASLAMSGDGVLAAWAKRKWIRYAQWRTEVGQSKIRKQLVKSDRQLTHTLSFSGRPE